MDNIKNDRFDLNALAEDVANRPAPQGCEEIARLFTNLPLWSSFINTSPKHEQKRALALLKEKEVSPTAEESFTKLCLHNLFERQRDDELAPYKQNSNPSTSRDPDSDEWKK